MNNNRSTHVIALAALLVAVVGLSIGFAAFTNTLTIKSSADVTPDQNTFNVDFSSNGTEQAADPVVATLTGTGVTAENATIDNSAAGAAVIQNLHAHFTAPGQKATYSFYAHNLGEYEAFLKSITFQNIDGESSSKKCTAGSGATANLVTAACEKITLSVKVGNETATTSSVATITNHSLAASAFEPVTVVIEYSADGNVRADGPFDVAFGDVVLTYNSTDA